MSPHDPTTPKVPPPNEIRLELTGLIEDCVNDIATPEQVARLDRLLIESDEARRFYARYMHTLCSLRTWAEHPQDDSAPSDESEAVPPPHVRDFLRNLPSALRKFTPVFWVSLVLLLGVALTWASRGLRAPSGNRVVAEQKSEGSEQGAGSGAPAHSPLPAPRASLSDLRPPTSGHLQAATRVARLVRTYDCVWTNPNDYPADGDDLFSGQELSLRAGLAEVVFSSGARVILQGPAEFRLESALGAILSRGKITAVADEATAKGFTIHSPGMQAIDLGTEFGLEVAANGLEQVHVFRGEVHVDASPAKGSPATAKLLKAHQGIEVNLNTRGAKLVANNGDRFARSLDGAQKNRHVIAYWRFEDHPVGVLVPESQKGNAPVRGSLDSSLNGNDLYSWSKDTQPEFSDDVPAATVPQTGDANLSSLNNSVPPAGKSPTRDLFTMSKWSQPPGTDLQTITPAAWTVEASVKPANLKGRNNQTFVARDGLNADAKDAGLAPFVLLLDTEKHFVVRYCDIEKRSHRAAAAGLTIKENHWYHVAVTSDGVNLKLYVDALDGKGYVLWAVTGLPDGTGSGAGGSTAMGRGTFPPDSDPASKRSGLGYPYIWSVGRGYYQGYVRDWFQGWIDEVRICDVALRPAEFLFAKRVEAPLGATAAAVHPKQ